MDNPTPTSDSNPPAGEGLGRRSFLLGGLAGLAGGAAGGYAANEAARRTAEPPPVPPAPPPPALAPPPDEAELERQQHGAVSYAQFGEDLILKGLFVPFGVKNPTYLDIGSADPIRANNTYLFYTLGARGVLVEPNVSLSDKIRRIRPGDKLLVAGIGIDDTKEANYYVMTAPDLNTFDKSQAEHVEKTSPHKLVQVVKMPLVSINRAIADNFGGKAPDLISIDIEGLDFAVLKTLDFARFRPKIICAETIIFNKFAHNTETPKLLTEKGYELRGMTYANMIFVDKNLLKD